MRDELSILKADSNDKPMSYTSKIKIEFAPESSSIEASRLILSHLLNIMKLNENGIISDLDIEFLHDFRVAIRRSRSFLSIVKHVIPESASTELKDLYKGIANSTNNLRDLDVLISDHDSYQAALPAELGAGLNVLFKHIKSERSIEQKKVSKYLLSDQYQYQIKWIESLINEDNDRGHKSEETVENLSSTLILKKYKSLNKAVIKTDSKSTDEDLHMLRIEFKKFRYLIEFFSSIYPAKEVSLIIKKLKNIQDELGRHNDLSFQHSLFIDMLNIFIEKGDVTAAAAIGGIISIIDIKQRESRLKIIDTVSAASDESIASAIEKISERSAADNKNSVPPEAAE